MGSGGWSKGVMEGWGTLGWEEDQWVKLKAKAGVQEKAVS